VGDFEMINISFDFRYKRPKSNGRKAKWRSDLHNEEPST
jgi:hypothetical protein